MAIEHVCMTDKTKMSDYERTVVKAGRVDFTAFQSSLNFSQDLLTALLGAPREGTLGAIARPPPARLLYSIHNDTTPALC